MPHPSNTPFAGVSSRPSARAFLLASCSAIALAACAAMPAGNTPSPGQEMVVAGRVSAIDRDPWAYDGDGLMVLATADRGSFTIHVPARTNLCRAQGLDVFSQATVGMHIRARGTATGPTDLTVCEAPSHRLEIID